MKILLPVFVPLSGSKTLSYESRQRVYAEDLPLWIRHAHFFCLVGVTALLPVSGAFIGTIVGAVMILTIDPFKAILFVIFLLFLQQIEDNMIYPKIVGSKINLPAL